MGGKTKQSQRTKNNVRPSSSGRSAELLNSSVRLDAGLVVASGKALPALFPSLAGTPLDVTAGLTAEFSLCLKKLNKKDPITKTKALQELTELVKNSKVEDVAAALPGWTHFYRILTVDTDRKVREATQVCHEAIVRACGRRIAPHLKQLLPAWLQAQHDDHAPAQSSAQASLASTFPESKLPEVISFCRAEVAAYLIDNLTGGIEAALNNKKEDEEERAQLYSRQVSSNLSGLQYFVEHLPPAHGAWLWEQLAPLLQANSFWKRASHSDPNLRSAWYLAVGSMIGRFGAEFGSLCGARTARQLLGARECGPAAAHLWACLLQLMHVADDWHKWIDKKDLLVKRILDVLENGGWGAARRLSDVLLPLLARLPPDLLTQLFLEDFFSAAFTGLEKKPVLSSKSERQAWITSISECLRYVSIQNEPYTATVVSLLHRKWLEASLAPRDGPLAAHVARHSASCMAALLKYWLRRSRDEDRYEQFVRSFWQNVTSTLLAQVDKAAGDTEVLTIIDGQVVLLLAFRTALSQDTKKQRSIKFEDDTESRVPVGAAPPPCEPHVLQRYTHNLQEVTQQVVARYLQLARDRQLAAALSPLRQLLAKLDEPLYRSIARQMGADSVYQLYERVLRPWLLDDAMKCRDVVDLVFMLMRHLSDHEQDLVFNSFEPMSPAVVEWCIGAAAAHPHREAAASRRWLAGGTVRGALLAACRCGAGAGAGVGDAAPTLMCLAHQTDENGELLVGRETVRDIVTECSSALVRRVDDVTTSDEVTGALEPLARFASALATALVPHAIDLLPALIAALFRLNLKVPLGAAQLSSDTWHEVVSSWQDGWAALAPPLREAFLSDAVAAIQELLFNDMERLTITKIEDITSLCPYLLSHESPLPVVDDLRALTRQMFAQFTEHSTNVTAHALRHDCVVSKLNCPIQDCDVIKRVIDESSDSSVEELTKEALMPYVYRLLFRAVYLRTMLLRREEGQGDEEEEEGRQEEGEQKDWCWCDSVLGDEVLLEQYCGVLHDHAVVCSLHESYAFWPDYDIIHQTKHKLDTVLADIAHDISPQSRRKVLDLLSTRAAEKGYYWSIASHRYRGVGEAERGSGEWEGELDVEKLAEVITGSGFFHSLQASRLAGDEPAASLRSAYLQVVRCVQAAHAHEPDVLGEAFARDAAACLPRCAADFIVNLYYTHNHCMLYERDISTAAWPQVVSNAAVCDYLRLLLQAHGWDLPAHHWDFTTITLCSLLCSVEKSKHSWGSTKVSMLSLAVLRLYGSVAQFVGGVPAQSVQRQPSEHVAALPTEWRDIFAPDLHLNLLSVLLHVLESPDETRVTSCHARVISSLQQTIPHMSYNWLPAQSPFPLRRVAETCAGTLARGSHHGLKYLAHRLLMMILKPVVLEDAEKLAQWSSNGSDSEEEERPRPQFALGYMQPALLRLHDELEHTLAHVRAGEEVCSLEAQTEAHGAALGCLLLDAALLAMCRLQRNDLTQHYIDMFREGQFAEQQLTAALRLLPAAVAAHALDSGNSAAPPLPAALFLRTKELTVDEPSLSSDVSALACRVVYGAVSGPGAARARGWWGCAAPRPARALERTVRAYVAPPLVRDQLQMLHDRRKELDDTEIRVHWSTQEAVCVYRVEERALALSVTLSRAHPLVPPRVATPPAHAHPHAPAPPTGWIALYLAYQNGTLLNALKMWCSAVSARVEAAPQCYICYCRLHPASGRLPSVLCHQCRNKFHSQCLRKWFTSSNKSNCPLCRSAF